MPLCLWLLGTNLCTTGLSCSLLCDKCDSSTWRCPADYSGDTLIFVFKENSVTVVAGRPLGAPGNMILSQEQRSKFAEDQTHRNWEEERLSY